MLPSLVVITVIINIAAIFWLGPGRDPDTHVGLTEMLATTAVFAIWIMGMISWGAALRRRLLPSLPYFVYDLALGSALMATASFIFGLLGFIGPEARWIFTALNYIGIFVGLKPTFTYPKLGRLELSVLSLTFGIVALRCLKSYFAWSHTDPLFYQIYGPRLWIDHGSIYFPNQAPIIFETGFWENLHIWGLRLLSSEPGRGLIEGQIFAQLTQSVIGYGGSALALYALCRRILKLALLPALISTIAGLSVRDLQWVAFLAKNDWGGIFWILTGVLLLFDQKENIRDSQAQPYFAGFFLGLGLAVKFTNIFVVGCILASWIIFLLRENRVSTTLRKMLPVCLSLVAALLCQLGRNYWFTQNPLFPFFDRWFHSPKMTPGLYATFEYYESLGAERGISFIKDRLSILQEDLPLTVFLLTIPFLFKKIRSDRLIRIQVLLVGGVLASAAIFLTCKGQFEGRHLGVILVLLATLGPASLCLILEKWNVGESTKRAVLCALLALTLFQSDLFREGRYHDWPLFRVFSKLTLSSSMDVQVRSEAPGGKARAWLRLYSKPEEIIMTTGDRQLYYLSGMTASSAIDDDRVASKIAPLKIPEQIVATLRSAGVRYLLEVKFFGKISPIFDILRPWLVSHPSNIVFANDDSVIIDLTAS